MLAIGLQVEHIGILNQPNKHTKPNQLNTCTLFSSCIPSSSYFIASNKVQPMSLTQETTAHQLLHFPFRMASEYRQNTRARRYDGIYPIF